MNEFQYQKDSTNILLSITLAFIAFVLRISFFSAKSNILVAWADNRLSVFYGDNVYIVLAYVVVDPTDPSFVSLECSLMTSRF